MRRVVAVVGATATGKTALAIALARALGGEIINADSRQIYRGMDIGTGKPTRDERAAVRHWLVDVAGVDETFTLARFLDLARAALDGIASRGLVPIVAGGTGQYVWSLLEGWLVPRVPPDRVLRAELEALAAREGTAALVERLREVDRASASTIHPHNARRLVRAIEVTLATGRPFSDWQRKDAPAFHTTIVGLRMARAALYGRIDRRVDLMIERGLLDEVRRLKAAGYSCDLPSMSGIGYRQMCEHLQGECAMAEAIARMKTETHRLARMQHTWFRPADRRIHWLDATSPSLAEDVIALCR